MARSKQSQWDFGELFASGETRNVLTVSELTASIKQTLEKNLGNVWVTGEISNFRQQPSGHAYFSLKDQSTQVACVLFRGTRVGQRGLIDDGKKVLLEGELTVYEPRGQYQLIVRSIELQGVGALQVQFDKLKQKLQAEGLFEDERKQPLPRFPRRIGVVTSLSTAALKDVIHVVGRRQPSLEILISSSRVQGQGAGKELSAALKRLNCWAVKNPLDLVLLTRGGGSMEDLWEFNDEGLARAIVGSTLPVVSAVGHEVDFTICDFVSDVRAATPSAAAEIITAPAVKMQGRLGEMCGRLVRKMRQQLSEGQGTGSRLTARLLRCHPRRLLQERMQRTDDLNSGLRRGWRLYWQHAAGRLGVLSDRMRRFRPGMVVSNRREEIVRLRSDLSARMGQQLKQRRQRLGRLSERLRLLDPANVLSRGYSITRDSVSGKVIRSAASVKPGQKVDTRV
ncbi:MAG: exodeoxyribonuclease VII large subunit, partial [Verrucomicrobiota bacterium]|nr:exodeoxyribonuclease VII large subunit [Verrucomicrobiota bacterium]